MKGWRRNVEKKDIEKSNNNICLSDLFILDSYLVLFKIFS